MKSSRRNIKGCDVYDWPTGIISLVRSNRFIMVHITDMTDEQNRYVKGNFHIFYYSSLQ